MRKRLRTQNNMDFAELRMVNVNVQSPKATALVQEGERGGIHFTVFRANYLQLRDSMQLRNT